MPFILLVILFIVMPIAEISVLIKVGSSIGGLNTILFVIFTAILGAYLVRQQGFATLTKLQTETQAGRIPALQIAEGAALLIAGAVLLTPGFITDAIGFTLLIPHLRRLIISFIAQYIGQNKAGFSYTSYQDNPQQTQENNSNVIEGEYTDVNPNTKDKK